MYPGYLFYSPGGQRLSCYCVEKLVFQYHCISLDHRKHMLHLPGESSIELWFLTKKIGFLPFFLGNNLLIFALKYP